jgi:hypothetical protein
MKHTWSDHEKFWFTHVRTDLSSEGLVKNMSILLESALVEQLLTIWYNGDISRTFVLADLGSKTSTIKSRDLNKKL